MVLSGGQNQTKGCVRVRQFLFKFVKMDVHSASAASVDDLSAVRDAIKRGEDVNSVNKVS